MGNNSTTSFPNIDFKFRRGYSDSFKNTPILNGSLNFLKDTRQFFVDVDDSRFEISSIIFDGGTEAEIRALPIPENKIYITSDTFKLLYFDRIKLIWHVVGTNSVENAKNATKATMDSKGNIIADYYYSAQDAATDHQNILTEIRNLSETVGSIVRFGVKLLNDESELPIIGQLGVIYFVPISNYSGGYSTTDGEEGNIDSDVLKDIYVELLWIEDPDFGGYYEIIGNTTVDLSNYYNIQEFDNIIATLRNDLSSSLSRTRADMINTINELRTLINSIQSSTTSKFNEVNTRIDNTNLSVASLTDTVKKNLENTTKSIEDLTTATDEHFEEVEKSIEDLTTEINNEIKAIKEAYLHASLINEG